MATMSVRFIEGISRDKVEVVIKDGQQVLHNQTYSYGYDASYNRANADIATRKHEEAKKYGWTSPYYCLKPFIGDILKDLIETYYIGNQDIEYTGYNVFANRALTSEEIKEIVDKIAEEV